MENIFTTIQPFYFVLKTFCMFSMTFKGSARNGKMQKTLIDVLTSCVIIIVLLAVTILVCIRNDSLSSSSSILEKVWMFTLVGSLFTLFVALCYQVMKRESIVNFLMLINEFDWKVKINETNQSVYKILFSWLLFRLNHYSELITNITGIFP